MTPDTFDFPPGSLVRARGREWIVMPASRGAELHLRPLGGSEEDETILYVPLELQPPEPASFAPPDPTQARDHAASALLLDALMLSLRHGAGPLRSFGHIAVQPRAYQLVPLLMALKMPVVRLLIADDVGIGKTIEAALIARELLDRGDIRRLAVLCPPHLTEQWQRELAERFHIDAVVVRSHTADRLERELAPGVSLFEAHPYTIVSLDYIKSDRRRDAFQRACPEFVIVDEAHTCTYGGQGRQLRYQLLRGLADDPERHLVLLTATPHSGDEEAFYNLLGLLRPEFAGLREAAPDRRAALREALAQHFVQRRRPDIAEWHDNTLFPDRRSAELTYRLGGDWGRLFEDVLDYARELVERSQGRGQREQRMNGWAALALLRCISSSPAAAVRALTTRLQGGLPGDGETAPWKELEQQASERILDGHEDDLSGDDLEPAAQTEDGARLQALIEAARALHGPSHDPKLKTLLTHVRQLLADGFHPVVFCRYIATAHYVAEALREHLRDAQVAAVTGELTSDEREDAVLRLGEADHRVLVATDCLAEGINLQSLFDAVVHYDLSWNPTRHEQREGRVDRFGQRAREVRCTMLYGENNPVDGAVLEVILRKAESIRRELGVLVPMPDDGQRLEQALMNAVLLRGQRAGLLRRQGTLDLFGADDAAGRQLELAWQSARDKAKQSRSIFAQRRLRPADVLPEWDKTNEALGQQEDVARFVQRVMARLGAELEPTGHGAAAHHKLHVSSLPPALRERLATLGWEGILRVSLQPPAAAGCIELHRTHPIVAALADYVLEQALEGAGDEGEPAAARCGAAFVTGVNVKTAVLLLRLRHRLTRGGAHGTHLMLCEQALAVAVAADGTPQLLTAPQARALLHQPASRNMPAAVRQRHLQAALQALPTWQPALDALARAQAAQLLADHRRVRDAADARGALDVTALLPVDVIGLYVLLPDAATA